jgi:uncharacterized protein
MSGRPAPGQAARALACAPIVVYQKLVSPALPRRCKYEPTCSRYALQAIGRYGVLRGLVLAGWRLLRCNPWSYGGYDPVEAQRVFRASKDVSHEDAPRHADAAHEHGPRQGDASHSHAPRCAAGAR